MTERAAAPSRPTDRPSCGTPRNDISMAVEMVSAARQLSGTAAYTELTRMACDLRLSVGDLASLVVRSQEPFPEPDACPSPA